VVEAADHFAGGGESQLGESVCERLLGSLESAAAVGPTLGAPTSDTDASATQKPLEAQTASLSQDVNVSMSHARRLANTARDKRNELTPLVAQLTFVANVDDPRLE
jgi:hypothetical protein